MSWDFLWYWLLPRLGLEAVEVHVAGSLDRADDRDRQSHLLGLVR